MDYEVKDFSADVLQTSYNKPVLVDFWAEWCGPCKVLGPTLERLAENNLDWLLVKVNSDENPELSAQFGIRSIPNVKLFFKGKVINEFVGALSEPAIIDWLKKNVPGRYQDLLDNAEKLNVSGKHDEALKMLNELLSKEPQNASAKILKSIILLLKDPGKAIELIKDVEETSDNVEIISSINTIAGLLNETENSILEESPTKNLYLEAVNYLKDKKFNLSLEKFIEIIKTDRYYAEDIARKACIAIFKYIGEENEVTLKYRRDFGRALYI